MGVGFPMQLFASSGRLGFTLGDWRSGYLFGVSPPADVEVAEARDPILYLMFSGSGFRI